MPPYGFDMKKKSLTKNGGYALLCLGSMLANVLSE